jgi:hypothetical protein
VFVNTEEVIKGVTSIVYTFSKEGSVECVGIGELLKSEWRTLQPDYDAFKVGKKSGSQLTISFRNPFPDFVALILSSKPLSSNEQLSS